MWHDPAEHARDFADRYCEPMNYLVDKRMMELGIFGRSGGILRSVEMIHYLTVGHLDSEGLRECAAVATRPLDETTVRRVLAEFPGIKAERKDLPMTTTTSHKRIEANRRNASRSTGPRSPQGKSRSRFNREKEEAVALGQRLLWDARGP